MDIFCYPSRFRIKSKADAARFPTLSNGKFYWSDGKMDYMLNIHDKKAGKFYLTQRGVWARGDVFSPVLMIEDHDTIISILWETRKHVNAKLAWK